MKIKLIILFTIPLFVLNLQAQDLKNSITIELGGGLAYSINYENLIQQKFVARAGFSYLLIKENQTEKTLNIVTIPLSINYLQNIKRNKHFIEIGVGTMDLITSGDLVEYKGITDVFINPYLIAGYRYRPIDEKWSFKLSLTPFYGTKSLTNPTDQGFMPLGSQIQMWGTVGIGYNF